MKKIVILFLTLFALTVFGQTETEVIKKAKDLIAKKKYETAFNLLDRFDSANDMPEVVLLKKNILLNYFVTSIMHQMFALKDLEENEEIMDYRGKQGSFGMQVFKIDSVLGKLIKTYPSNCKLYKGLGDYYYDTHLRYGNNWLKSNEEQFQLMKNNFQKAVDGNCADYLSYYVLGYINLVKNKAKESIPYFLNSIKLNKVYASSHYNLAYAYLFTDNQENALKYAKTSLDLYEDKVYKSDAARMLGQIYMELKDDKNALKYYEKADKINPKNYYNIKPILNLYIKTNSKKVNETTKSFFNLAPSNPTIYDDLDEIYLSHKKDKDLIAFYKSQFSRFEDNEKVKGNLNFYLARIYINIDKKNAKFHFTEARKNFAKIFEKNHSVFNAIEDGLKQCKE